MNQANPVLAMLNHATKSSGTMASNPMQMMAQFAEFKKIMAGKNPEAIVKQMLANGQMSNEQFEELKQQATMMQAFLK